MTLEVSMPPRQKGGLDVALLCSKLEDHQRLQEAARVRRSRSHAAQKGIYIPRSAAAQFAVTTTSRSFDPQRRSSLPAIHAPSKDLTSCTNKKSSAVEQELPDLDKVDSAQTSPQESSEPPPRSPKHQKDDASEEKPRGYKPGTAAKRRTVIEPPPTEEVPSTTQRKSQRPSSFHPGELEFPRNRRPGGEQVSEPVRRKSETTTTETRKAEAAAQRPNNAMYNRPDWAQQSQNGDEIVNLLHLPRMGNRESAAGKKQQENRLVADAVKIIQEEQRSTRRRSIMGFFKKR